MLDKHGLGLQQEPTGDTIYQRQLCSHTPEVRIGLQLGNTNIGDPTFAKAPATGRDAVTIAPCVETSREENQGWRKETTTLII